MKKRVWICCFCTVISILSAGFSIPSYNSYIGCIQSINENKIKITDQSAQNKESYEEFLKIQGKGMPNTLEELLDFIEQYENAQVNEIKSFRVKGEGIELLNVITNISKDEICDGYEITVSYDDAYSFMQYLDSKKLFYHSTDFFIYGKYAVLRIRVGGMSHG